MEAKFDGSSIESHQNTNESEIESIPRPPARPAKLSRWNFFHQVLGSPRHVLAPMVEQSELPWRLLARRHGAQLCFTPMLHAAVFLRSETYRQEWLMSCAEDRPLIAQFCANDPDILLAAARLAEPHCDAVDLNLGCPQNIARRGHYGAFLQDDWRLVGALVGVCHRGLLVPVTAKIRVFENEKRTVEYASMLADAGAQMLTVHGRTREQKGVNTGLANWRLIRAVVDALPHLPIIANGNVEFYSDIERCIEETHAAGVMSAEAHLHNPWLFSEHPPPTVLDAAEEYLHLVQQFPCALSCARAHLFKIFQHALFFLPGICELIGQARTLEQINDAMTRVRSILEKELRPWNSQWFCQPYRRPESGSGADCNVGLPEETNMLKRTAREDAEAGDPIAITKMEDRKRRKWERQQRRAIALEKLLDFQQVDSKKFLCCPSCVNNASTKCSFKLCRACCALKVNQEKLACPTHRFDATHEEGDKKKLPTIAVT